MGTAPAVKGPKDLKPWRGSHGWPGACSSVSRVVWSGGTERRSHPQPLARQEEQTRVVRQFHFHGWPEIGIPAEGKGMIDLIAAVQKQQQQTGNHPITVHCR